MLIQERISGPDTLLKLFMAIDDGVKAVQSHLSARYLPRVSRGGHPPAQSL
jgi:hypothetical protein